MVCVTMALAGPSPGEPVAAQGLTTDPTRVRAGAYALDPAHGKITWSVSHLGFSTYYGHIVEVAARLDLDPEAPARSRLSATIGTGSIDGQNDALNAFLRGPGFFDAARFPTATFTGTAIEPTSPTTARISGTLSLRGVTKPVAFDATFNRAGPSPSDKAYTVGFDGRAVIKCSDFGLGGLPPALGDEVTLRLEGEFKAIP